MVKFPRTTEDLVVLDGKLYNRIVDELERLSRLTVAPPLRLQDIPGGRMLSLPNAGDETITVRLTSGTGPYDWKEVTPKSDGTVIDVAGGRTSDPLGKAISAAGATFTTGSSTGDVVVIRRAFDPVTGAPLWLIVGSGGVDVYTNGGIVQAHAGALDIAGTNGTSGVLQYVAATISGTPGAKMQFKTTGVPDYAVLGVVSGNVVFDYPRVS